VILLMQFDVSASEIAMYLRDKGLTSITQKDIANWSAKIRNSGTLQQADEVCRMVKFFSLYKDDTWPQCKHHTLGLVASKNLMIT